MTPEEYLDCFYFNNINPKHKKIAKEYGRLCREEERKRIIIELNMCKRTGVNKWDIEALDKKIKEI